MTGYPESRMDKKGTTIKRKIILTSVGFLFLVLLITAFFGKKGLLEIYQAKKNYKTLLQEIESLKGEKSRLEREIEELGKNPRAVDKEAREKLWLMKPDEKVIVKKKNTKEH